jgi:hypothetical protein
MQHFGSLRNGAKNLNAQNLMIASRITISTYANVFSCLGILIYILTTALIRLTENSLFVIKILPFPRADILVAKKLFKLIVSGAIFELFFVICAPLLTLVPLNMFSYIAMLCMLHIIFIATFLATDLIYSSVLSKTKCKIGTIKTILDVVIGGATLVYLLRFRYFVDFKIAKLELPLVTMLSLTFVVFSLMLVCVVSIIIKLKLDLPEYKAQQYVKICSLNKMSLVMLAVLAVVRTKLCIFSLVVIVFALVVIGWSNGISTSVKAIPVIWSMMGITFIGFANSTFKIRKFFDLMRISVVSEVFVLIISILIINLPIILMQILTQPDWKQIMMCLCISLEAVFFGTLFPKHKGNLNDFIGMVLLIIGVLSLYLVINIQSMLPLIFGIITLLTTWVLHKERQEGL